VRAREFISEAHEKFSDEQLGPMPGAERYDGLDNSNPYAMWRFIVAAAGMGGKDNPHPPLNPLGPIGQKLSTLAYSTADADILNATAKAMGEKGTRISTQASEEPTTTNKTSPVKGFKGYRRK
jgi:hypothetical protein